MPNGLVFGRKNVKNIKGQRESERSREWERSEKRKQNKNHKRLQWQLKRWTFFNAHFDFCSFDRQIHFGSGACMCIVMTEKRTRRNTEGSMIHTAKRILAIDCDEQYLLEGVFGFRLFFVASSSSIALFTFVDLFSFLQRICQVFQSLKTSKKSHFSYSLIRAIFQRLVTAITAERTPITRKSFEDETNKLDGSRTWCNWPQQHYLTIILFCVQRKMSPHKITIQTFRK